MIEQFPKEIEQCFEQGATRLGETLKKLEFPNGGKDAPCNEDNVLINISFYLSKLTPTFHVYAEANVAQRCRVDMIGCNGKTAFALEAKAFGAINPKSDEALRDFNRLQTFRPSLTKRADNEEAYHWWDEAESRWAIIVISSFRGRKVSDAWLAKDENVCREIMSTYTSPADRPRKDATGTDTGFLALHKAVLTSYRGVALITDGLHWGADAGEGWLLWAANPISRIAV